LVDSKETASSDAEGSPEIIAGDPRAGQLAVLATDLARSLNRGKSFVHDGFRVRQTLDREALQRKRLDRADRLFSST
jgi:hypothetical protein